MLSDHTFCSSCCCNCIQEAKPCGAAAPASCRLRGRGMFYHSSKVTL